MISDEVRDAYLTRLGLEREVPSVDALFRLHAAHVERVPYETLWIQLGEQRGIGLDESVSHIARSGRGGYCYHLNGALSELLLALGYDVTRHIGGVHGPDGITEGEMTNHLVLLVHGLPHATNPDGTWYVDAGLGDALHAPLPLIAGTYTQPPFTVSLDATAGAIGDWHLTHDAAGSFTGTSWWAATTAMDAFAATHERLSTSPDSGFVKFLVMQRREATAVDMLRGLSFRRLGDGATTRTLETRDELETCLRQVFAVPLDTVEPDARAALWTRVRSAHDHWLASQGAGPT